MEYRVYSFDRDLILVTTDRAYAEANAEWYPVAIWDAASFLGWL